MVLAGESGEQIHTPLERRHHEQQQPDGQRMWRLFPGLVLQWGVLRVTDPRSAAVRLSPRVVPQDAHILTDSSDKHWTGMGFWLSFRL